MDLLEKVSMFKDDRGLFSCLISGDLDKYSDLNYAETAKNQIRGNHYHKHTRELFIILEGEIELEISLINENKILDIKKYNFKKLDVFEIKPYEYHTIRTLSDCKWISILSNSFDPNNPDLCQI